eukprot:8256869-Pyramimonas_sp.AAC.1
MPRHRPCHQTADAVPASRMGMLGAFLFPSACVALLVSLPARSPVYACRCTRHRSNLLHIQFMLPPGRSEQ